MITHDVAVYSFRAGPGKEWRTAVENIENGVAVSGVFAVLRSSNRRRLGLYARERRHPPVSPAPISLSPRSHSALERSDLKPENLLLDDNFRLKITDFGTGKILDSDGWSPNPIHPKTTSNHTNSTNCEDLCWYRSVCRSGASREQRDKSKVIVYLISHLISLGVDRMSRPISSDLWALGCILYQMIAGRFAFHGLSEYLTWQKVKALDYTFPDGFDQQAKDLVQELLIKSPSERLGAGEPGSSNDMKALKAHPFFASIDWTTLWTVAAPTLESGLVKKEPKPANNNWDDVGYNWDHVVAFPRGHDEIPRTGEEDEDELDQRTEHGYNSSSSLALEEEEERSSNTSEDTEEKGGTETVHPCDHPPAVLPTSKPILVPALPVQQDSFAMGSTTSSSEGSPIEKLGAVLEAALRGRGCAQTPIQGNGVIGPNWSDFCRYCSPVRPADICPGLRFCSLERIYDSSR